MIVLVNTVDSLSIESKLGKGFQGQMSRWHQSVYTYFISFEIFHFVVFQMISSLPVHELPWKIPEEEIAKRRDFRKDCIFTIDPATARDLDDALSCEKLEDG